MTLLLLDAHSHLHPAFSLGAYLEGARDALVHHTSGRRQTTWQGCLWVAETETGEVTGRLERARTGVDEHASAGWSLTRTEESVSWVAHHPDGQRIFLILGSQLRTNDGFEVLQIGSLDRDDGPPTDLRTRVARVLERGAYPVIPWGFGKWTLRRKGVLLDCLRAWDPADVALADSALRPRELPGHPVLAEARQRGFTVLAGTDPLPLPPHERGSGRYVAALDAELSTDRPWADLRDLLPGAEPALLGQRDRLLRSLRDQVRLRLG